MTALEQYKKAYALLVGRVDTVISNLENASEDFSIGKRTAAFVCGALTGALQDAEEIFLAEDPEEE